MITKLFETSVTDGLLGSFKIDDNGDPEDASGAVVGFTIYVATDELDHQDDHLAEPGHGGGGRRQVAPDITQAQQRGGRAIALPPRFALESPRP